MLVYIDDCLVFSHDPKLIDKTASDLKNSSKNFDIDDQGDVSDFLGIEVTHLKDRSIKLTQPHLIDLHLQENTKEKKTNSCPFTPNPAPRFDGEDMGDEFHYRSVIGKLNFLEKSTRIDISYSVHQCAHFSENPKKSHASAVKNIGWYLKGTRDKGLILKPYTKSSCECWVDCDFTGNLETTRCPT